MVKLWVTSWYLVPHCRLLYNQCNIHWYQWNEPYICVISGSSKTMLIANISVVDIILDPWTHWVLYPYSVLTRTTVLAQAQGSTKLINYSVPNRGMPVLSPSVEYCASLTMTLHARQLGQREVFVWHVFFKSRLFWLHHCTLHMWNKIIEFLISLSTTSCCCP